MANYTNIRQIEAANAKLGHHFFEDATLRFFKSRIGSTIYSGRYFITSERGPDDVRRYSIREAHDDGRIKTLGDFGAYDTSAQAARAIQGITA